MTDKGLNTCIIGIGSNIDPVENIRKMLELLSNEVEIIRVSSLIKTEPIGIRDQPSFTNGAVKINTHLTEQELQNLLKKIEDDLGRDRTVPRFGPRSIDLDIVAWNGKIRDKDYYTRDFLRKSVNELL